MSELDLINFLEWLDCNRVVVAWENKSESHEDVAQRYLAEKALTQTEIVDAAYLESLNNTLSEQYSGVYDVLAARSRP